MSSFAWPQRGFWPRGGSRPIGGSAPSVPPAPTRALQNAWSADSGLALTGNRVDSWTEPVRGHVFLPTTPLTTEMLYVANHPEFRGRPVVQNNFASTQGRVIAGTVADYNFLHDGTGGTAVVIGALTSSICLNTSGGGLTGRGFQLRPAGTTAFRVRIGNGAANICDLVPGAGTLPGNVCLWIGLYESARVPPIELYRGITSLGSTTEAAAPSAANSAQGLELMCNVATECSFAEIRIHSAALTLAEIEQYAAYARQKYSANIAVPGAG